MINIAICDDEKIFLEQVFEIVSNLLKENEIKFEIDSFISGEDLLKEIESGNIRYDIIFLDIIMANGDGIEVGKKIKEIDENIYIVYISSSKEFLLDGYDVGAFNYILKPIDENRLKSQIFKLLEKIRKNEEVLEINKAGIIIKLKIEDIKYCEVKNRIITIFYKEEIIEYYDTIRELEKNLIGYSFIRPHRSYLVNPRYIFKIQQNDLVLDNGESIPISRLKIKKVKEEFKKYIKRMGYLKG